MGDYAPTDIDVDNAEGAEDEAGTYVLLPRLDAPGEYVSVFNDGSWARYVPLGAWDRGERLLGCLPLVCLFYGLGRMIV